MKYSLIAILLFLSSLQPLFAQYRKRTEKLADDLYAKGDYYNAAIFYKKLLNVDSSTALNNYKYAQALRNADYNDKALYYYNKTYQIDRGKEFPDALFWMAQMYKYQYDYGKAKRYFKRTERYFKGNKNTFYYAWVKQEQLACDFAQRLYSKPLQLEINNLGNRLNTVYSEFGAYLFTDSLMVYSALRPEQDSGGSDTSFVIRMYEAQLRDSIWSTSSNLLENINSDENHIANGVLNTRGNKFYFTQCDSNGCRIMVSLYFDGEWGEAKDLGNKINKEGFNSTQPHLARMNNDEFLFFVSDRPGGEGNLDIWYARTYSNGVFEEPVNAGQQVNTLGDELSPFFDSKSNRLFFSSNWHLGLGSFDIFESPLRNGSFQAASNLGYPINSSVKDFYFRLFDNKAFLTSNRPGSYTNKSATCCNDIYSFTYATESYEEKSPLELAYDSLISYLPLKLYFHNDEPNPRSTNTTTSKNYIETYHSYYALLMRYQKEYAKGLKGDERLDAEDEIADFFDLEVREGAEKLQKFTAILQRELNKGRFIRLTLKGFASPLSKSDYNAKLTQRRINCIENFFSQYDQGSLMEFINKKQLVIVEQPFGEDRSSTEVSDNINDKRNSVYSKKAAFERRVEIISLDLR